MVDPDATSSGKHGTRIKRTDSGFAEGSLDIVSGILLLLRTCLFVEWKELSMTDTYQHPSLGNNFLLLCCSAFEESLTSRRCGIYVETEHNNIVSFANPQNRRLTCEVWPPRMSSRFSPGCIRRRL